MNASTRATTMVEINGVWWGIGEVPAGDGRGVSHTCGAARCPFLHVREFSASKRPGRPGMRACTMVPCGQAAYGVDPDASPICAREFRESAEPRPFGTPDGAACHFGCCLRRGRRLVLGGRLR